MKVFKNADEAEELEKTVMACYDLSDHNKIILIRCIENAINESGNAPDFNFHYREVSTPKKLESSPNCSVRGLS